ncbi:hypothetical protein C0993_005235 [Termitomyces sp. T159_Od127]|nr:hypothetical protein C0993_005235 [Termitomyces sp. T159_Od127]
MKLKEIHRTSTFAWSPTASLPLLATGTVAGALDESFSNESQLEIWAPNFLDRDEYDLGGVGQNGPKGVVKDSARFNRLAWGGDRQSRGVIAAGLENGELALWDPSKILAGAGCDADLLLSCGKDNRALCWNPQTSEIIGELPSADNWAFQVDWCPRNPDLLATAFFDGTVGIHSIQSTNEAVGAKDVPAAQSADVFDIGGIARSVGSGTLSLKQPPKWLRRPASSSFGFGGKLVSVSNLPSAQGKNQSSVVHIRKIVTEQDLVERATKLQAAIEGGSEALRAFAEERSGEETAPAKAGWRALLTLFQADSRDELVTLLGFSKAEIAARVAEAVDNMKVSSTEHEETLMEDPEGTPHEPVVSFAEPERTEEGSEGDEEREKTPSEVSASVDSDTTSATRQAESESATTVPSLFGDEGPGMPVDNDNGTDFFSAIAQGQLVPHMNYGVDSSVAATVGSGPSSVASEALKSNSFRIYPNDESDVDRLVTKALVLGDFESAVSLCLSSDRFADAILLAVRGGPELLQRTQKAYFERRTTALPYLRVFQSIVTDDLADIVQNADLQEWQEIFVVLCTFARQDEFQRLAEELGRRLEFQFTVAAASESADAKEDAREYRQNATLTYLAAARLERLVNIWVDELAEEERTLVLEETGHGGSRFSAHTQALQTFIEKVTVFRSATAYKDADLVKPLSPNEEAKEFKLASLYDRYLEYADLLTTQGLVKEAVAFLQLTPEDYAGSSGVDFGAERARLLAATGVSVPKPSAPITAPAVAASKASVPVNNAFGFYPSPVAPIPPAPQTQPSYAPYNPYGGAAPTSFAPAAQPVNQGPYAPPASTYNSPNIPYQQSLAQPPHMRQQMQPQPQSTPQMVPPPPRGSTSTPGGTAVPPPPLKRNENGGWNDPPAVISAPRAPSSLSMNKSAAITAPFPNQAPTTPGYSPLGSPYNSPSQSFPPPRPGSVPNQVPPPPPAGQRANVPPPPGRPASRTAPAPPPPQRIMSPPQVPLGVQQPPAPGPGPHAVPPARGPISGQTPPPGPYGRPQGMIHHPQTNFAPPPPHGPTQVPAPGPGPYGPGPSSQPPHQQPLQSQPQPGPYEPPPGAQRTGPPQLLPQGAGGPPPPPPPPGVAGAPPRTTSRNAPRPQAGPPPPKYRACFLVSDYYNGADGLIWYSPWGPVAYPRPQQKRLVDDLERRINPLFDALNCETLSRPVVDQLVVLTRAMEAHDRPAALAIHVDLLTKGSVTDDIGLWMSGVKQLIMRL